MAIDISSNIKTLRNFLSLVIHNIIVQSTLDISNFFLIYFLFMDFFSGKTNNAMARHKNKPKP